MVEVALAMAVVGLGVAGILSLFPIGLSATRDAVADNAASNAVESFLSTIKMLAKEWDASTPNTLKLGPSSIIVIKETNTNVPPTGLGESGQITGTQFFRTSEDDIIGVKMGPASNPTEFTGHLRLWMGKINFKYLDHTKTPTDFESTYDKAARVMVELSWPCEIPYERRSKRLYSVDLFNDGN
jgi:hypothetical protein